MAIRPDSFSSVDEVRGFTRHLLDGHTIFDASTRPTITEIEKFIDRASALMNVAIDNNKAVINAGLDHSDFYNNAVSKLACDDWVTQQAVKYVHCAQRNTGIFSEKDEVFKMANPVEFIEMMGIGLINQITDPSAVVSGIYFTGIDAQNLRADPDDTTKEQPLFSRRKFENT